MCLSTIEPRKNLVNTIKAFIQLTRQHPKLDLNLIVCGKKGWKVDDLFENEALKSDRILFTGFIDDLDLPLFYANARALCYISFYEGFGLPILEAMRCGTPAIYGNNSSMPEVAGESGIAVAPDNVEAISTAMYNLATDNDLYKKLTEQAWIHSSRFSWEKVALQTMNVYQKIIDRS